MRARVMWIRFECLDISEFRRGQCNGGIDPLSLDRHGDESNPRAWPSGYAPDFPLVLPQARTKAIISSSRKSVPSKNTTSAPLIHSIIAAVTAAAPGVKGTEERRCRFARPRLAPPQAPQHEP